MVCTKADNSPFYSCERDTVICLENHRLSLCFWINVTMESRREDATSI